MRATILRAALCFSVWTLSAPAATNFHYADLEKLIRDHQVTRVDDLLPLLPEEYRRYYTFVYQSRSQQKDNVFPEYPRTILYGDDARFIMAFTKAPSQAPAVDIADTIETIDFDDTSARFTFRELTFHDGKSPLEPAPEANPATCLACHGSDPRPNWDSYNVWPGVYGSVSRLDCDSAAPNSSEKTFYQNFLKTNRQQGRYVHLPAEKTGSDCPKGDEITIANAAQQDPNAVLTEKIFELNNRRLKRMVASAPHFDAFKYLWEGAADGCLSNNPETFFPPDFAKKRGLSSFEQTLGDLVAYAQTDYKRRLTRFLQTNSGSPTDSARQPINFLDPADPLGGMFQHRYETQLLKFAADRAGLSMVMDRWATAFTDGSLDFATPHNTPISTLLAIGRGAVPGLTCDELRKKSVEAIAAL